MQRLELLTPALHAAWRRSRLQQRGQVLPRRVGMLVTPREQQIVEGLRAGLSNEGIAIQLGISMFTVKNHVRKILRKLGANNRAQAARERAVQRHADEGADHVRGDVAHIGVAAGDLGLDDLDQDPVAQHRQQHDPDATAAGAQALQGDDGQRREGREVIGLVPAQIGGGGRIRREGEPAHHADQHQEQQTPGGAPARVMQDSSDHIGPPPVRAGAVCHAGRDRSVRDRGPGPGSLQVLVMADRAALPVGGRADGVAIVALLVDQDAAQLGHRRGFAGAPSVALASGHAQGASGGEQRLRPVHPAQVELGAALQGAAVALRHVQQHEGAGAGGQFLQAARDGRQRGLVASQQVPVEVGRDHEGAARPCDRQRVAGLRAGGPFGGGAVAVLGELEHQFTASLS
ncbi:bacterial regulatory protein, luxR family domain-containing protein [Ditylenchus destructor]|nr:bacterial regulatory protein, luxR family domain-containing protein [Ditylenchus destructor]